MKILWKILKPGLMPFVLFLFFLAIGVQQLGAITAEEIEKVNQLGRNVYGYIGFTSGAAVAFLISILSVFWYWEKEEW